MTPLFRLSGTFVVLLAFELLSQTSQQVAFLLALALLHGVVATFFAVRHGPVDPFGLLAAAYVITLIVLGVLLIASAWAWARLKPPTTEPGR